MSTLGMTKHLIFHDDDEIKCFAAQLKKQTILLTGQLPLFCRYCKTCL